MSAAAQQPILIDATKGIEAALKVPSTHSILQLSMGVLSKRTPPFTPESAVEYALATSRWCVC